MLLMPRTILGIKDSVCICWLNVLCDLALRFEKKHKVYSSKQRLEWRCLKLQAPWQKGTVLFAEER